MILLLAGLVLAAPSEAEVLAAHDAGSHLTARRLAEELLAEQPRSFIGHYVVGSSYYEVDGNLARARYHLSEADEIFVQAGGTLGEEAWRTHWHVLRDLANVAGEMEDHDLEFESIDRYNELYAPKLLAERGWSLMKLERWDDARRVSEEAVASEDDWQVSLGWNVLCAVESQLRQRQAAFDACNSAYEHNVRTRVADLTVDAHNAGLAAETVFRFDVAEKLLKEATRGGAGSSTNPWTGLSWLYLQQGRGAEAAEGVRRLQAWRLAQPPAMRAQARADADVTVAALMLAAGYTEGAVRLLGRALDHPDRRASTSADKEDTLGGHTLMRMVSRRAHAERRDEEAATWGLGWRALHWLGSWLPDLVAWRDHATVSGVLANRDRLEGTVAPYQDGGLTGVPTWVVGDVVDVLGAGVVDAAVDRARDGETAPEAEGYYLAFDVETAWARGRLDDVVRLADQAVAVLPEAEVLLRARLVARSAAAARRRGGSDTLARFERVMQLDPGVLRRLDIALPARVEAAGGGVAEAAAAMIRRSPRLARDRGGFVVTVDEARVCLATPMGTRLGCWDAAKVEDGTDTDRARAVAAAFHDGAFGLPVGLSGVDLNSLDGTTVIATEQARERMQAILEASDGAP